MDHRNLATPNVWPHSLCTHYPMSVPGTERT